MGSAAMTTDRHYLPTTIAEVLMVAVKPSTRASNCLSQLQSQDPYTVQKTYI